MGAWFPRLCATWLGAGNSSRAHGPTTLPADSMKRPAHGLPRHSLWSPQLAHWGRPVLGVPPHAALPTPASSQHVQTVGAGLQRASPRLCAGRPHMGTGSSRHRPRRHTGGSQHPAWLGGLRETHRPQKSPRRGVRSVGWGTHRQSLRMRQKHGGVTLKGPPLGETRRNVKDQGKTTPRRATVTFQ